MQYLRQKKAQLAALGQWTHINCLRAGATARIQDAVLQRLVYVPDTPERSSGSSTKDDWGVLAPSRVSSLLEAVDLENVLHAMRPPLPVEQLPGGAVSFLFERTSKTPLEETVGEDDNEAEDI